LGKTDAYCLKDNESETSDNEILSFSSHSEAEVAFIHKSAWGKKALAAQKKTFRSAEEVRAAAGLYINYRTPSDSQTIINLSEDSSGSDGKHSSLSGIRNLYKILKLAELTASAQGTDTTIETPFDTPSLLAPFLEKRDGYPFPLSKSTKEPGQLELDPPAKKTSEKASEQTSEMLNRKAQKKKEKKKRQKQKKLAAKAAQSVEAVAPHLTILENTQQIVSHTLIDNSNECRGDAGIQKLTIKCTIPTEKQTKDEDNDGDISASPSCSESEIPTKIGEKVLNVTSKIESNPSPCKIPISLTSKDTFEFESNEALEACKKTLVNICAAALVKTTLCNTKSTQNLLQRDNIDPEYLQTPSLADERPNSIVSEIDKDVTTEGVDVANVTDEHNHQLFIQNIHSEPDAYESTQNTSAWRRELNQMFESQFGDSQKAWDEDSSDEEGGTVPESISSVSTIRQSVIPTADQPLNQNETIGRSIFAEVMQEIQNPNKHMIPDDPDRSGPAQYLPRPETFTCLESLGPKVTGKHNIVKTISRQRALDFPDDRNEQYTTFLCSSSPSVPQTSEVSSQDYDDDEIGLFIKVIPEQFVIVLNEVERCDRFRVDHGLCINLCPKIQARTPPTLSGEEDQALEECYSGSAGPRTEHTGEEDSARFRMRVIDKVSERALLATDTNTVLVVSPNKTTPQKDKRCLQMTPQPCTAEMHSNVKENASYSILQKPEVEPPQSTTGLQQSKTINIQSSLK
jgi:hypothetical protein